MPSISLVICTHNGSARLAPTIAHIAAQTETHGVAWEIIVVDNGSNDQTTQVAANTWVQTGRSEAFRVIREPVLGAQYARMAGARAAAHDIVCFVDDDNWLAPNWVATASRVMASYPDVGACGGMSVPVFESQKPLWFNSVADAYAVGDQYVSRRILSFHEWSLWGAGLCVRRDLILKALEFGWQPLLPCRAGTQLTSGGDTEVCMLVRMAGFKLLYEPDLKLQHFVATSKCDWNYVVSLMHGFGEASVILFQYASVVGLAPHNTALGRLRMWSVSKWMLEVIRAAISYAVACVQAAASREDRIFAERMRLLKRGRLAGLMDAQKTYGLTLQSIRLIARKLAFQSRD